MSQIAAKTWHFLKENTQGTENGECRFRYEIAGGCLHFCFEVEDGDIISPYGKDNDDIWQDDAVEVFLSPSGDPARYKEIEVSPFGVRFYGDIRNRAGISSWKRSRPPTRRTHTRRKRATALPFACPSPKASIKRSLSSMLSAWTRNATGASSCTRSRPRCAAVSTGPASCAEQKDERAASRKGAAFSCRKFCGGV